VSSEPGALSHEPTSAPDADCPLCGTPVAWQARRCPECGWSLAGVDGRPGPYSKAALWWTGAAFLAIYVVTLAIVALTH
jgi:hypothetical protein